jgi:hypothetical protein
MRYDWRRHSGIAAVVLAVVGVIALILVLHIIFVLLGANSHNAIVSTVGTWSWHLAAWFRGLFQTGSGNWDTVLDYGLAALAYLFVGRLVASVVERV